ncbi:GCN5-related N-acetyltransferase [Paenibacillus curdlanolyticus YK9]|uniref:GCN5-related N-acetyltransferase n=1 Tax=Paenibacillus curdlanolyticus YK9 TaxID=717606 RepID=E0IAC4_9BACL|nr:GNAT family N-acetyltransferase [Paenibacillus curdlanolyticus]EFM10701.1 GCN5-related N-acetyltransferase [Paenibacillus curdlanolyticus YK9]
MNVIIAVDKLLVEKADQFLFEEMWKPYGMDESIRNELKLEGEEIPFVAVEEERVIGVFILMITKDAIELRHAAVSSQMRSRGIGKAIWQKVLEYLADHGSNKVELYARNSSVHFWRKLNFQEVSDWLDHPLFVDHGIRFKKMEIYIQ